MFTLEVTMTNQQARQLSALLVDRTETAAEKIAKADRMERLLDPAVEENLTQGIVIAGQVRALLNGHTAAISRLSATESTQRSKSAPRAKGAK